MKTTLRKKTAAATRSGSEHRSLSAPTTATWEVLDADGTVLGTIAKDSPSDWWAGWDTDGRRLFTLAESRAAARARFEEIVR